VTDADEATDHSAAEAASPRAGRVARAAIAIVFGLLFAWALYQAISNALQVPQFYDALGIGDQVPWWLLVASIAIPPLLYLGAFLVTRRMAPFAQTLVFLVALATSYASWLSIVTLAPLLVA
jgi:hypothetical protein